jgi:hypothetical protein
MSSGSSGGCDLWLVTVPSVEPVAGQVLVYQ